MKSLITIFIILSLAVGSAGYYYMQTGAVGTAVRVFSVRQGGTGTATTPSFGEILVGQSDGSYSPQATSTLGFNFSPFAWTPTDYGVSTSTTLGFTNGFLSTASSTVNAGFIMGASATTTNSHNFLSWIDLAEIASPSAAQSNALRLFANDDNGFSVLKIIDPTGDEREVLRDNYHTVRNNSGVAISKGDAVYKSGSTGVVPEVTKAQADALATSDVFGLALEDISDASFGRVLTAGDLGGLDTSAFSDSDALYLSTTTAGALVNYEPTHPHVYIQVGSVIKSGAGGSGIITVDVHDRQHIEDGTLENTFAIGDETAGTKSLTFSSSADGSINWDGTQYWLNDGDVGIGTSTPISKLHVVDKTTGDANNVLITHDWHSPSQAQGDTLAITRRMRNSANELTEYFRQRIGIETITAGSEDGSLTFDVINNGSLEEVVKFNSGETEFNASGLDRDAKFTTAGNADVIIKGDGSGVGIGTLSPTSTLQVSGGDVHFQNSNDKPGLYWDQSLGRLGIGTTTPTTDLHVYDTSVTGANNNLITTEWISSSPANNDQADWLELFMADSGGARQQYARIRNIAQDITAGSEDGRLQFSVVRNGILEEAISIDPDEIIINDGQVDRNFIVKDANGDVFTVRGATGRVGVNDATPDFQLETTGSAGSGYFGITNTTDGDILTVDSSGQFGINTTNPATLFDVLGTASSTNLFVADTATTTNLVLGSQLFSSLTGTGLALSGTSLTVDQTFSPTWTGAHDFGGATSVEIKNGASFTFNAIGEMFFDTTANQLQIATSTNNDPAVIGQANKSIAMFTISSTTQAYKNNVVHIPPKHYAYTMKEVWCNTDQGQVTVTFNSGTAVTCTGTRPTAGTSTPASAQVAKGADNEAALSAKTGTPNWLEVNLVGTIDAE